MKTRFSFVERSELGWDEYAGKHVTLSRMLEGSILFVRPVSPCMAIPHHCPAGFAPDTLCVAPRRGLAR
jgi:hypothetical protein